MHACSSLTALRDSVRFLKCRMVDSNDEHCISTFARINTQEVAIPRDFTDFWQEPTSSFLASGACQIRCRCPTWVSGSLQLTQSTQVL